MQMRAIAQRLQHGAVVLRREIVEQIAHIARRTARRALQLEQRVFAILHRLWQIGHQRQRAVIALDRLFQALHLGQRIAAIVPTDGVRRIERQHQVEIGNRLGCAVQLEQQRGAARQRFGEIGLQRQRPVEAGHCFVMALQLLQHEPARAPAFDEIGIEAHRVAEKGLRIFELTGLNADDPERIEGLEVHRIGEQDLLIEVGRFPQPAGLLQRYCAFQERVVGHGVRFMNGRRYFCTATVKPATGVPVSNRSVEGAMWTKRKPASSAFWRR